MRLSKSIEQHDPDIRERLLLWANGNDVCCILNSNKDKQLFTDPYSNFDFMVAAGVVDEIVITKSRLQINGRKFVSGFDSIREFHQQKKDWLFGFLSYDLEDNIVPDDPLMSENQDTLEFPELHFFQPRYLLKIENGKLNIEYLQEHDTELSVQKVLDEILGIELSIKELKSEIQIQPGVSKQDYISTVEKIKQHIQRGDIYELNYCVEYFAEDVRINPVEMYLKLNEISPMPFSSFYKMNDQYLLCASPERFIAKRGKKIISQPIKGTARRGKNAIEDEGIKEQLKNDPKEQSENVMIVDLVRNDLSRTAVKGSVQVEELFGIYTFRQLHQMISTIVSDMRDDVDFTDVIRLAFPMGSMTGAPKVRAMQLIEQYEGSSRGMYSGSVGYITPGGDFDFNVVIRSILFNARKKYLSFKVGSAITSNSIPEKEYEECLLKANAMLHVLSAEQRLTMNH